MMTYYAPGIYTIGRGVYHTDALCPTPSLSASIACCIIHYSPMHAKARHPRLTGHPITEEGEQMDIGSIAHELLLEGTDRTEVLDYPDWRTKEARLKRDQARLAGRIPILKHKEASLRQMLACARRQFRRGRQTRDMFRFGKPEQTLIWQDDHDLWCRARVDWLRDDYASIDDYKTTSASANPEQLAKVFTGRGWDMQAAFYLRGLKRITGVDARFRFAVQECEPPYAVSTVSPDMMSMALADRKVQMAIDKFAQCLRTGRWPGYDARVAYLETPPWEEKKFMELELR